MSVSRVNIGAFNLVFNAANTPTAGAFQAGDKILIFTGEALGSDATPGTPAGGWVKDSPNTNASQIACYRLDSVTGAESMPSFTWGNQWTWAVVAIYRGLAAGGPTNSGDRNGNVAANGTTCFTGPSSTVTPSQANSLVLFVGEKNKSSAANGATVSAPSNFTVAGSSVPTGSGTRSIAAICEWIQGTATAIPANTSSTQSIADTVQQSNQAMVLVYAPLTATVPAAGSITVASDASSVVGATANVVTPLTA